MNDLKLLHAVIAYARANGWEHDTTQLDDSPLEHRWRRGEDEVSAWNTYLYVNGSRIRPASVRQAVDVIVALGHLPAKFSSGFAAGKACAVDAIAAGGVSESEYCDGNGCIFDGERYWCDAGCPQPPTEEPTRTLTAVERDAEQYIAPVGAEEVPVDVEARIAQALDHIAAGRAVVWPAAGADDPNDEITGGAK